MAFSPTLLSCFLLGVCLMFCSRPSFQSTLKLTALVTLSFCLNGCLTMKLQHELKSRDYSPLVVKPVVAVAGVTEVAFFGVTGAAFLVASVPLAVALVPVVIGVDIHDLIEEHRNHTPAICPEKSKETPPAKTASDHGPAKMSASPPCQSTA